MKTSSIKIPASEHYIKKLIDSMIDSVLVIDTDLKILFVNRSTLALLGHCKEELIGKPFNILCADKEMCQRNSRLLFEKGAVTNIETFYKTSQDTLVPVVISASVIKGDGEYPDTIVLVAKDNTKHRETEALTAQKQQELAEKHVELNALFRKVEIIKKEQQRIMDSIGDMIILTDDKGKIKRINSAVKVFAKKPFETIIGAEWETLLYENHMEAMMLHEGSTELLHKPSGKWYALNAYPFEDAELAFSGNVITIHETTNIKKISEELETYSQKINRDRIKVMNALDQLSVLMQNVTEQNDTSIRLSNRHLKKCYELKNCSKKECSCYGKEAMRCWQIAGTFCGGNVQGSFAQKYHNCSGCEVFKEATLDPINQIGEYFNNMMHVLEVRNTDLKNANAELRNTQAQILQQEKMASVGQLAAGVAHEINNPMGFISSNLGTLGKYVNKLTEYIESQSRAIESLKEYELSEGLKETRKRLKLDYVIDDIGQLIGESLEGADRVKKIVQNLKTFSRVDQAEYKPADINECIESTLNIVWNELKYKTTVEKEYGELPLIKCYPQQLNQVFMNLLVNGAQAIEKQGIIRIKTWNGDGSVNISISDTGSGIPEDKLSKIFDPFFTTKPVGQGTGLGLSIAYDIIKKHKGDIKVESKVGSGTLFTIKIPVLEEKQH